MPALRLFALLSWLATAAIATAAQWTIVAPGVEHLHLLRDGTDLHAVRVDLQRGDLREVANHLAVVGTGSPH